MPAGRRPDRPTTAIHEDELEAAGVNIVIYANHCCGARIRPWWPRRESILEHGRSLESDEALMPIKEILRLIPGGS